MRGVKKIFLFLITLIFINFISASCIQVWKGQYYTGTTFNKGTYNFNFTVYDNLTGGNSCYSATRSLTTGNWGQWEYEAENVGLNCNNASKEYFLNINIDGEEQLPRKRLTIFDFLRRDVEDKHSGNLIVEGNLIDNNPLRIKHSMQFVNWDDEIIYDNFVQGQNDFTAEIPDIFNNSLIYFKIKSLINDYGYRVVYFDNITKQSLFTLSRNANGRASTMFNLMVIPENKTINPSFNLCEGNYVDCESNEPDLLVYDDIESGGNIYSNGNTTAKYFIGDGSLLRNLTKEVFFQAIPSDGNLGDFRTQSVASGAIWRFNFQVPSDFSSLQNLEIVLIPLGTNPASSVDLYSDYGAIGENYSIHSEEMLTTWNLNGANKIHSMNISGVFTNLTAGDFCGIQVDEGAFGFAVHYLGVRLKYKT